MFVDKAVGLVVEVFFSLFQLRTDLFQPVGSVVFHFTGRIDASFYFVEDGIAGGDGIGIVA